MSKWCPAALLLAAAIAPALAQSLQVSVISGGSASTVAPGGSAALAAADVGPPVLASVTVRYTGTATVSITGVSITGTSEMTLLLTPTFPVTLNPYSSTSFTVQYLPSSGNTVTAQLSIAYLENNQALAFPFLFIGNAPRLAFSYFFAPSGSLADLNAGDRITFPSTNVGTSSTAVLNVFNRGSAPALVQSISVNGSAFALSGSQAPIQLTPGSQTSFNVTFTPRAAGGNQGLLVLGLGTSSVTFSLTGTGTSSVFTVSYTLADGVARSLSDGTAIQFPPVDINGTATAAIDVLNQGTGTGAITGISITGNGFRLSNAPTLPTNLPAGQAAHFSFVFAPTQIGSYQGTFRIDLTGRSISGTLTASTAASNITLAYIDPDTKNILPLSDGGVLPIPKTAAGAAVTVTMVALNSGAGTGQVTAIALGSGTSSAFQLVGLPSFPVSVPPSQQLQFGVRFSPTQQQSFTGSLAVTTAARTLTVNLRGDGVGPQFTYTYGDASAFVPGGTLTLSDTTVGQSSSVTVTIGNNGAGDGQIAALSVSGQGLSLADVPALPFTVRSSASQKFTLNFAPTQPGAITGKLIVGADTFTVAATAIGSRLNFTYTSGSSDVTVTDGGTVIFPPIQVGKNGGLMFSVQNTGTTAATLTSVGLAEPGTVFSLSQLPGLPMSLAAGATVAFPITFAPNNTGGLTATLRVNGSSFTLSGTGTQPSAVPSYEIKTSGGGTQAAQQSAVALTLSAPYPVALQGTLKLTFASAVFTDDPSIQFATGGRTVNFTIPANSTSALFNGNTSVPLQTGTTAGTIVITPSFAMSSGFDMTPATPDTLSITIARAAPQLLSASIASQTLNSFSLVLSGFTTTRVLRQFDIQITPKSGETFTATKVTVDVSSSASAWFQGTASQSFGGSFLVAIPFNLSNGSSTDDLVHRLQSLTITAVNDVGPSNTVTAVIQ